MLAFAASAALQASEIQTVGLTIQKTPDGMARATSRTVASILAYSHWPQEHRPLRLCVGGSPAHADLLTGLTLPNGTPTVRSDVNRPDSGISTKCDALYLGPQPLKVRRDLLEQVRNAAVVTIVEDDPYCRIGAMFCLYASQGVLSFRLNIDAVSRSQVRVDPRVLRVAGEL
ncbi:MAG: YfiR family protein [Novosphingobium sp.]|nr:YfiR family protein [Novosphingobium sp.]